MKTARRTQSRHFSIATALPVILFFFFALTGIAVIIFGAKVYKTTVQKASMDYSTRTAIAYLTEKIRQNDTRGTIRLGDFRGHEALILSPEETVAGNPVQTFIYHYADHLCELTTSDPSSVQLEAGTPILPLKKFHLSLSSGGLLHFRYTDDLGDTDDAYIAIITQEAGT